MQGIQLAQGEDPDASSRAASKLEERCVGAARVIDEAAQVALLARVDEDPPPVDGRLPYLDGVVGVVSALLLLFVDELADVFGNESVLRDPFRGGNTKSACRIDQ